MVLVDLYLLSLPLIGAVIGWFTNLMAVKLIFRPYRPVNLLVYKLQGVVPKRREELAKSIGQVIEKELLSTDDLLEAAKSEEAVKMISEAISISIKARIMEKLPVFMPVSMKKVVTAIITDQIRREIPPLINEMFRRFSITMKENISFHTMVEDRINNFSLERIEKIILSVAAKEFRHIEMLGGALGFFIGFIQALVLYIIYGG